MLAFFSNRNAIAGIAVIFLLFAIAIAISLYFPYGEYCSKDEYTNAKECASYHIALVFFFRFIKSSNDYGVAITALATLAVAVFTGTLWWAAAGQYDLLKDQIQLAREEFTATHRPKIIVHGMDVKLAGDGEFRHVNFRYVNAGDTDAFVTLIASHILWTKYSMVPAGIEFRRHEVIKKPVPLPSGKNGFAITPDDINFTSLVRSGRGGHDTAYCVGVVVYRDKNDIERRTGFCRRYDSERERWLKADDEDYEYAY